MTAIDENTQGNTAGLDPQGHRLADLNNNMNAAAAKVVLRDETEEDIKITFRDDATAIAAMGNESASVVSDLRTGRILSVAFKPAADATGREEITSPGAVAAQGRAQAGPGLNS